MWNIDFRAWRITKIIPRNRGQIPNNAYGNSTFSNNICTVEPGVSKLFEKHKKVTIARFLSIAQFGKRQNLALVNITANVYRRTT